VNLDGLQRDIDAIKANLHSRKAKRLSKKERAVFLRWLKRIEEALENHRQTTGAVE
jgi:transposase-like protein